MAKSFKNYYRLVRFMRANLPIEEKLSIRRVKMPKNLDGDCCYWGKTKKTHMWYIRIDRSFEEYYAIEVLLHELAHILAWDKDTDDHGLNWGKAYSRIYREFLKWNSLP